MPVLKNYRYEVAAQAYALGKTKADAYREAGFKYSGTGATKLFQREEVVARVKELAIQRVEAEAKGLQIAAEKVGVSKEWVLQRLKYNAERCLRGQPILDKDGKQTGQFTGIPQGGAANRALELIGRELGMFIQRHEIGEPGEFDRMSTEELEVEASKLAVALGISPPPKASKTKH